MGKKVDCSLPIEVVSIEWGKEVTYRARVICVNRQSLSRFECVALFKTGNHLDLEQVVFFDPDNGQGFVPLTHHNVIVRNAEGTDRKGETLRNTKGC